VKRGPWVIVAVLFAWCVAGWSFASRPAALAAARQVPRLEPQQPPAGPDAPALPDAEKRRMDDNEKNIKEKVDKLYQLATELKAEVDKTDSSKVLSLALVKKAEEIEKLAKDIKNRSKGT